MAGWIDNLVHDLAATTAEPTQWIETHISWVILCGEWAYKIKKPVDLGFVDFSTLERRARFCREELRLNRRLAPELYVDVVPIAGSPERPVLGGGGAAFEYAVRMRRFPQEQLLPAVLARGELLPGHIDRLARDVAEFHARCPSAGPELADPSSVAAALDNFARLQLPDAARLEGIAGGEPAACDARRQLVQRLAEWTRAEAGRLQPMFAARLAAGFVRECHGDMHLGNMVLLPEGRLQPTSPPGPPRILIFDGIEFSDSLRWIDVLCETAFCMMDLEDRGRRDLGWRFLNGYLEWTGDYAGLPLLPFFLCYRAMVRAKVACIRLGQMLREGGASAAHAGLLREIDGYLEMAARFARLAPSGFGPADLGRTQDRPALLIMHGVSGSGKSYVSQQLLEQLPAVRIRSDVERRRLFGIGRDRPTPPERTTEVYSAAATERVYRALAELSCTSLTAGFMTIADATNLRRAQRALLRNAAKRLGFPAAIVSCEAPREELEARLERRTAQAAADDAAEPSEATCGVLAQQWAAFEPLSDDERAASVTVSPSSREDPVGQVRALLRTLTQHPHEPEA